MKVQKESKYLKLSTAEIHRKVWMFFIEKVAFTKEHNLVNRK